VLLVSYIQIGVTEDFLPVYDTVPISNEFKCLYDTMQITASVV